MTLARRLLIFGGVALAIVGMAYGWWFAVFAEHQTLDHLGSSLTTSFVHAAGRDSTAAALSLAQYREARYIYDRQVDVHGHWIGLAMLLIVIGIGFDRLAIAEKWKFALALGLLLGAVLFPLGVLLQTSSHGSMPRAVAILGSGLVIASLAAITAAIAFRPRL